MKLNELIEAVRAHMLANPFVDLDTEVRVHDMVSHASAVIESVDVVHMPHGTELVLRTRPK